MPSQVNGLGIDNVDQIAMTMKSVGQKKPSPPHPMHRKVSVSSMVVVKVKKEKSEKIFFAYMIIRDHIKKN